MWKVFKLLWCCDKFKQIRNEVFVNVKKRCNLQLSHEHWILRNWSRNQSRNWTWTQQKTAEKEKLYLKYYKLEIEKLSSGKKTFRIIEMLDTTLRTISLKLQLNCTINDKKQKYTFYWSRVFCISSIRLLW